MTDWRRLETLSFDGKRHPQCTNHGRDRCQQKQHPDCTECRACPRCQGTLYVDRSTETLLARSRQVAIQTQYICLHCGAWLEREILETRHSVNECSQDGPIICAVFGCNHRTWSKLQILVATKTYPVCDRHKRQHQRWVRGGQDPNRPHLIQIQDGYCLDLTIKGKP